MYWTETVLETTSTMFGSAVRVRGGCGDRDGLRPVVADVVERDGSIDERARQRAQQAAGRGAGHLQRHERALLRVGRTAQRRPHPERRPHVADHDRRSRLRLERELQVAHVDRRRRGRDDRGVGAPRGEVDGFRDGVAHREGGDPVHRRGLDRAAEGTGGAGSDAHADHRLVVGRIERASLVDPDPEAPRPHCRDRSVERVEPGEALRRLRGGGDGPWQQDRCENADHAKQIATDCAHRPPPCAMTQPPSNSQRPTQSTENVAS